MYDTLGASSHLEKFTAAVEICTKSMEGAKTIRKRTVTLTGAGRGKEAKRKRRQNEFRNTQALINRFKRLIREAKRDMQ